ncbi:MAG: purine-nucleoside phosphorylase [Acidobacteriota bacterium]
MSEPNRPVAPPSSAGPAAGAFADPLADDLQRAVDAWHARDWPVPQVLVVSGSGLATDLGTTLEGPVPWAEILPFPVVGIEGHPLTAELLEVAPGRVVLSSRGRLHAYQGYTLPQVVFTIRLVALLGSELLLMTNSAGGLHAHHRPGDLVLLRDHLNLTGLNPLWGRFPSAWGVQFPDMMRAYDPDLRTVVRACADELDLAIEDGVYAGVAGPSYETPAEVRMLRGLGGDVVGMSTVPEIIAGHHIGLRCGCVSVVANAAAGVTDEVLDHADVLARGRDAAVQVARLFQRVLAHHDLLQRT